MENSATRKSRKQNGQLFLEFNRAGFLVGSGRNRLRELGLTTEEQKLFDEQTRLIEKIMPMQERVTDYLAREEVENAWSVLVAEAIPMQERLNERSPPCARSCSRPTTWLCGKPVRNISAT